MLQTDELHRDAIFWHFPAYLEAYNKKQGIWRITPAGAIRSGDWKLIEFFEDGRLELYDLSVDIGESNNLGDSLPQVAAEMHSELRNWRDEVDAKMPYPKTATSKPAPGARVARPKR